MIAVWYRKHPAAREIADGGTETGAEDVLDATGRVSVWGALTGSAEGRIALVVAVLVVTVIIIGPLVTPYPPLKIGTGRPLAPPSWNHLFGTDDFGRDVFSRFLAGGRSVFVIPLVAAVVAVIVGGWLGMLSAYHREYGRAGIDRLIARAFDIAMTVPPLLIVLVLVAALGSKSYIVILVLGFVFAPRVGRLVRGVTATVITNDYVLAAQARGENIRSILARDVAPNIAAPIAADFALRITYGVLFVATLNFLGVGAQPPAPNWGLDVAQSVEFLSIAPWATLAPIAGIVCVSIPFNLIADVLVRVLGGDLATNDTLV